MADKILHKRSSTTGSIPTTSSLELGELALNTADGKIFFKKSGSAGESVQSAVTTDSITYGTVTLSGSLVLTGSSQPLVDTNLLDVTADEINFDFDTFDLTGSFNVSGSTVMSGSLNVTGGITGSLFGTASYVPNLNEVTTAGNTTTNDITVGGLTVDTDLIYTDTVNNRVGINTSSPLYSFHAVGSNFRFGRRASVDFDIANTLNGVYLRLTTTSTDSVIQNLGSNDIGFNNNFNRVMTLKSTGNVLIGTTTDGARLRVKGSGTTNATTALRVENANASVSLSVNDAGNVLIGTTTDAGYKLDVNGTARFSGQVAGSNGLYIIGGNIVSQTGANSGRMTMLNLRNTGGGYQSAVGTSLAIAFTNREVGNVWTDDVIENIIHSNTAGAVTTGYNFYTHNNQLFNAAPVLAMSINGTNVGIGTSTPAYNIDVSGSGRFTDGLTVTGSLVTQGQTLDPALIWFMS